MQPSRHYIQANLTELNESLALLVELDNKIPQSLTIPFGYTNSVSLQLTISLQYYTQIIMTI